jgi:hypothetical protein
LDTDGVKVPVEQLSLAVAVPSAALIVAELGLHCEIARVVPFAVTTGGI